MAAERRGEPWRSSLARILGPGGTPQGAGFLVDELHICTCAHVVNAALGRELGAQERPPKEMRVDVAWLDGTIKSRKAEVVAWRPMREPRDARSDIAILRLRQPVKGTTPAAFTTGRFGQRFCAVGFPLHKPEGASARGELRISTTDDFLEVVGDDDRGERVQRGFSGGAVWLDGSEEAVGMVGLASDDPADRTALIIPIQSIAALWPLAMRHGDKAPTGLTISRREGYSLVRRLLLANLPALEFLLMRLGIFSRPADLDPVAEYLRKFESEMRARNLSYLRLDATDLETTQLPTRGRDEAVSQPIIKRVRQTIRMVLDARIGGDQATAQLSALNSRSRIVRNVPRRLDHTHEPLILLGDPGTGKSMTLREVAGAFARRGRRRSLPIVPVFIRLSRFDPPLDPSLEDVEALVRAQLPQELTDRYTELVTARRLALFFDGMDELPRRHYNPAVEILSRFADANSDRVRCLFSCRINDFSPEFRHRQLVLLPFGESQVREYLEKNIDSIMIIGGEKLTRDEILSRLFRDPNFEQYRNPHLLFLFCEFLQNGSWPESRADLLGGYFKAQIRRQVRKTAAKEATAKDIDASSDRLSPLVLTLLGRLAFEVMQRNRTADIVPASLDLNLAPNRRAEAIRVARACGFLAQDEEQPGAVRFDHHRYQEFFAAHHIVTERPELDWSAILDDPRWQEVLINLAAFRAGAEAFETLLSITDERVSVLLANLAKYEAAKEQEEEEAYRPSKLSPWGAKLDARTLAIEEMQVADRVELIARIVREARGRDSAITEPGIEMVERCARRLATSGNPSTQVKMLWAAQYLPEIPLGPVLMWPRESKVSWVREQALRTEMALATDRRVRQGTLADRIAADLADRSLLRRSSFYWKTAVKSGERTTQAMMLIAWTAIALAVAATTAIGWISLTELMRRGYGHTGLIPVAGVAAAAGLWWLYMRRGFPLALSLYGPVIVSLGLYMAASQVLFGTKPSATMDEFAFGIIALAILGGILSEAFLLVMFTLLRPGPHRLRTLNISVKKFFENPSVANVIFFAIFAFIAYILGFVGDWLVNKFPIIKIIISIIGYIPILILAIPIISFIYSSGWRSIIYIALYCTGIASIIGILILLNPLINDYMPLAMILISLLLLISFCLFYLWRRLRFLQMRGWLFFNRDRSAQQWRAVLAAANPVEQKQLLDRTTHHMLNMTPSDFFALLIEIEPSIQIDPALSGYWAARHRVERILRQAEN